MLNRQSDFLVEIFTEKWLPIIRFHYDKRYIKQGLIYNCPKQEKDMNLVKHEIRLNVHYIKMSVKGKKKNKGFIFTQTYACLRKEILKIDDQLFHKYLFYFKLD